MKCPDCGTEGLADPESVKAATNAAQYLCPVCKRPLLMQCDCGASVDCYDLFCPFCNKSNPIQVSDSIEIREKTIIRILQE
jgi:transcription elongation factor Elf1